MTECIIADDVFDRLEWKEIKVNELSKKMEGFNILETEPIIDGKGVVGVMLYAGKSGDLIAVEMLWESFEEVFLLSMACVPMRQKP